MKLFVILLIFSSSIVYAEPKNTEQVSPKMCLETIYKKNFESAHDDVSKKTESLIVKVYCRNQDKGLHSRQL